MTAALLVATLRGRGLRLRVAGETVLVAPRARLLKADLAALRAQKADLLAVLRRETADPVVALAVAEFPGATIERCRRCGGDRWRPNLAGDGEYCVRCTTAAPLRGRSGEPDQKGER